jgi:acetate kinase
MSDPAILALNIGSSSVKFALYGHREGLPRLAEGEVAGLGNAPWLQAQRVGGELARRDLPAGADAKAGIDSALQWLATQCGDVHFAAIGHRIVHGGTRFRAPVVISEAILGELEAFDPLAPLHQPFNLAGVRILCARYPEALAVACFDTAFHTGWADVATRFAIPRRFHDAGVRRYGFHGLSYEYLSGKLSQTVPQARRAVLAHLGGGASLCALRDGRSIDCTMGFSVLDGLPMATRSGTIDPGVIFHLHRQYGLNFEQIEQMLYRDSGLLGVSGISGDMRALLADTRVAAREAVALFAYHCAREIGAMIAVLGGMDALVFSGGVGAQAAAVRQAICAQLECFGVVLNGACNETNAPRISVESAGVPVFAWPTDEEGMIARHCAALMASG